MEAEEQFMEDADVGVGDIIQEMEGSNIWAITTRLSYQTLTESVFSHG
jgi:hypothetical protein